MRDVLAVIAFGFGLIGMAFNWFGWIRWMRGEYSPEWTEHMMKLLNSIAGAFLLMIACWVIAE